MKLSWLIGEQEVVMLIDCGATLNFVSTELVKKLQLTLSTTDLYGIAMGASDTVPGEGICYRVQLYHQDLTIVDDFLPHALSDSDVIMGM